MALVVRKKEEIDIVLLAFPLKVCLVLFLARQLPQPAEGNLNTIGYPTSQRTWVAASQSGRSLFGSVPVPPVPANHGVCISLPLKPTRGHMCSPGGIQADALQ